MVDTALIARLNWVWEDPDVAFSGGSWVATATVRLANLLNLRTESYARTTSAAVSNTVLAATFGAARRIDHVWLGYTNASDAARVRVLAGGVPLDIDFTAQTAETVPTGWTFARSTEASYFNASGVLTWAAVDEPRYDHDPLTLTALGYLDEASADCRALDSEDFSAWTDDGATVATNSDTAPDGATAADRITEKATTAAHGRTRAVTWSALTRYRVSWFAKDSTRSWQCLRIYDGSASKWLFFNANTGAVGHASSGVTSSVQQLPNGWWRVCAEFQASIGAGVGLVGLYCATADGGDATPSYAGGTGNRIIVWGAMAESGTASARPSSYVRTTTSNVTRAADGGLTLSGAGFSAIVPSGAAALSLAAAFSLPVTAFGSADYPAARVDGGSAANRVQVGHTGSGAALGAFVNASSVSQMTATGGTATQGGTTLRAAVAITTNDGRAAFNGTLSTADTSLAVPTVDRLVVGGGTGSIHVARVAVAAGRVADADLDDVSLDLDDFDAAVPALVPWQDIVPVTHTPSGGYIAFGRQSAAGKVPTDERDPRGVSCLMVLNDAVDVETLTIQIEDPANTDGYFQIATLWAGMSARPAFAPIAGAFTIGPVEESRRRRSLGGTLHARRLWARRRITAALEYSAATEALAVWLETAQGLGGTQPVLFSVLPPTHIAAVDQPRATILGVLEEPTPVEHQTVDRWRWAFSIVEL